jgi:hypothetical protein
MFYRPMPTKPRKYAALFRTGLNIRIILHNCLGKSLKWSRFLTKLKQVRKYPHSETILEWSPIFDI